MRIGFIGVGAIGGAMVRRLVDVGHEVQVYARRPEVLDAFEGVTRVDSPQAVAEGAELVALCPLTDEQVRDIAFGDDVVGALEPGAVLVIHTTGSPRTAQLAQERGVRVVDAPIDGSPAQVLAGGITMFVGASDEDFAAAESELRAIGDPLWHMGGVGQGQAAKLVNNAMLAAHMQLAADATRLGAQLGVDPVQLTQALLSGTATSYALSLLEGGGIERLQMLQPYLDKDFVTVKNTCAELGLDLGLLEVANDGGPVPFGKRTETAHA